MVWLYTARPIVFAIFRPLHIVLIVYLDHIGKKILQCMNFSAKIVNIFKIYISATTHRVHTYSFDILWFYTARPIISTVFISLHILDHMLYVHPYPFYNFWLTALAVTRLVRGLQTTNGGQILALSGAKCFTKDYTFKNARLGLIGVYMQSDGMYGLWASTSIIA